MNPGNGKGPGPDHAAAPGPSGDETRKAAAESRSSATAGAGRMLGAGVPAEKPKDLRGSVRRMAGLMSPERSRAISVVVFALVSVNLAVINFLPLPIVDGGQFLMIVYEWVRGKPVPVEVASTPFVPQRYYRG